jgi:hypothetical protein
MTTMQVNKPMFLPVRTGAHKANADTRFTPVSDDGRTLGSARTVQHEPQEMESQWGPVRAKRAESVAKGEPHL